jgi:hypothetical protein
MVSLRGPALPANDWPTSGGEVSHPQLTTIEQPDEREVIGWISALTIIWAIICAASVSSAIPGFARADAAKADRPDAAVGNVVVARVA